MLVFRCSLEYRRNREEVESNLGGGASEWLDDNDNQGRRLEKLKTVIFLVKRVSFFTFIKQVCSLSFQFFRN